jgi:hypothetical protein
MLERTNKVARVGGWDLICAGKYFYWTSVTKEIHGCRPIMNPTLTRHALEFYKPGESREMITEAINNAISKGTPWNLDLQIANAVAKKFGYARSAMPFGRWRLQTLYGTFQDIDDHKRAEIALMQAVISQKT